MSELLRILGYIPKAARFTGILVAIVAITALVYLKFGLSATLFLIGAVLFIYLAVFLYNKAIKVKQRQDGLAFGKALNAAHSGPSKEEVQAAVGDLGRKWQEAMSNLKTHNIDIYQLPWYVLVGEPQSGKSTTLKFSGLRFPIGQDSISGGGGTRNCDWWFTDSGVILDTAGRFTFHEKTATDAAEWDHFLALLQKHRPGCPINGVILVIPIDALLNDDAATLEQKARNISEQLLTIQRKLAIQFPVYLMITKCDQIYGFTQFFNKLSPDQQREIFGWSNPDETAGFDVAAFETSFDQIAAGMDGLRRDHLQKPHFIDDLDKTYVFPEEFRAVREPLKRYMETIFRPSVYKDPPFFRGYFFSSGMQEGLPIVKACGAMIRDNAMLERLENVFAKSRAFFVRDFYAEKVFPEEGLVRRATAYAKRDTLKKRLIYGANAAMFVLGVLTMWLMYSSLVKRLEKPKNAIQLARTQLEANTADVFASPEERRQILTTMNALRGSVEEARQKTFLIFLKGQQNDLTGQLQNTFSYLFLDRIMLGVSRQVDQQLRAFQINDPSEPRSSQAELDKLTRALAELKKWRLEAAKGDAGEFKPTLTPFLAISVPEAWDAELPDFRGDQTMHQVLEAWFQEVYGRSTPAVRRFVIQHMVNQTDGLFNDLHNGVARFYANQPELKTYEAKVAQFNRMDSAYTDIFNTATVDDYHERLTSLAENFEDDRLVLMASEQDVYLDYVAVRDAVIRALGPAFVALKGEQEDQGFLERASSALNSGDGERRQMPDAVTFVNRIMQVDAAAQPNPRGVMPPNNEDHLHYPPNLLALWEDSLKPYTQDFHGADPYAAISASGGLNPALRELFESGSGRVRLLKKMFDTEAFAHSSTIEDERLRKRFEDAMTDFHDALAIREQDDIAAKLGALASANIALPPEPPARWRSLVTRFNELSQGGRNFDGFVDGPKNLAETIAGDFRREMRTIFFNRDTPDKIIQTYMQNAGARLGDFGQTLAGLNAISDRELAQNKSKYLGSFPQGAQLQDLKTIPNTPDFMQAHANAVGAWADAALDAFRTRVSGADPCPECRSALSDLQKAYRDAGDGFPLRYDGQTGFRTGDDTGAQILTVTRTPEDKLKALIDAITVYRDMNDLQRSFLRQRRLTQFVEDALKWADTVSQIQNGGLEFFFQVTEPETADELDRITDELTLATFEGAFRTSRLSLITPRLLKIEADPAAADPAILITFYNDAPGNQTKSFLTIEDGLFGLVALSLDGSTVNQAGDYRTKSIILPLNTGIKSVEGVIHLKANQPLASPPDWSALE